MKITIINAPVWATLRDMLPPEESPPKYIRLVNDASGLGFGAASGYGSGRGDGVGMGHGRGAVACK